MWGLWAGGRRTPGRLPRSGPRANAGGVTPRHLDRIIRNRRSLVKPGPDSAGESVPAGTVYVAIADAAGTHVATRQFLSDRQRVRVFTVQMALDMLRRRITGRG